MNLERTPQRARRLAGFAVCTLLAFALTSRAQIRDGGIDPWNLGKGDWIYSISDATNKLGGHYSSVTNETSLMLYFKSQGVRYVMVKAATNDKLYNACYGFPQFNAALVNTAHANGILIFGYNRSYGSNVVGEIAIADYVFSQGADGFVFDAESEWESSQPWIGSNGPALAWQLCSAVRSNWPTKFLAHAPFPIISYHNTFPYKEFGYWCDTVMPQIYHSGWTGVKGTPSGGINWSDVNWANWHKSLIGSNSLVNGQRIFWTNSIKPLAPVENVYGPGSSAPCTGTASALPDRYVMEFIDYLSADPHAVTPGGYQGVNFWRADLHGTVQWTYMKAGTSGDFPGTVNNIVIDDPRSTRVGTWSSVRTFYNGVFTGDGSGTDTNSFGTNYMVSAQGTGADYVQFTPQVVVPGDYNVYQWHVFRTNASASVPFIINYYGGTTTVYANQQTNAGGWSLLGKFPFGAGTAGYVRITDAISEPAGMAIADGLKLVFVPPSSIPAVPGSLTATAASSTQINLNWTDTSTNETGFVISRAGAPAGPYADVGSVPGGVTSFSNSGLSPNTTYYYQVRATNYLGASANRGPASATTMANPTAPSITGQPASLNLIAGEDALFTVTTTGSAPLRYQWWFGSTPVPGATTSSYTQPNAQPNHAGAYSVVVTNDYGAVTSSPASLTISMTLTATATSGGTITRSPEQGLYAPGSPVTLTATAGAGFAFLGWSGDASGTDNPLAVTLNTNLSILANFVSTATDIILDNPDPAVSYVGTWQTGSSSTDKYAADYRFALTDALGLSNVTYRPYIYSAGLYDVYAWYPQGSNRATNAPWTVVFSGGSMMVPVDQTSNGGGWVLLAQARPFARGTNGYVRLSNGTGYEGKVVLADAVRFTYSGPLPEPPSLLDQPQPQTVKAGSNATFSVSASGASPLTYQWFFESTPLAGGTANTYTVSAAQTNQAGGYWAWVTNIAGSVTSSVALLTVLPLSVPVVTSQPVSRAAVPGGSVEFSVIADSASPLSYQWQFNGADLPERTNAVLTLAPVQAAEFGSYAVRVSNDDGSVLSDPATLTLAVRPALTTGGLTGSGYQLSFATEPGPVYEVQYKTALDDSPWQVLQSLLGTGAHMHVLDPAATNQARYYRVQVR